MNYWLALLIIPLAVAAVIGWRGKLDNQKKLALLGQKFTNKNSEQSKRYKKLTKSAGLRLKTLQSEVLKMEYKTVVATNLNKKLVAQNEEISKKITQLYSKKQDQIKELESELEVLKLHLDLPSTSTDQMQMLKHTVERLDGIIKEEHDVNDQQLLKLENRLMEFEPIETAPTLDMVDRERFVEDDLTLISGIGPKFAEMLNQYGVSSFLQLAELSDAQVFEIQKLLGDFSDRIINEKWVEQARELAKYRH